MQVHDRLCMVMKIFVFISVHWYDAYVEGLVLWFMYVHLEECAVPVYSVSRVQGGKLVCREA